MYQSYLLLFLFQFYLVAADYYECNEPLLEKAQLSATSSLRERGPENARLDEGSAWTARDSDFDQSLVIDLGEVRKVTGIATQGRPHSMEFTREYTISYGTNGLDFSLYKEPSGNVKMFKGNNNGDGTRRNTFEGPIIAQWIRINPTRWQDRISLRLELYGCQYVAENMYFNGSSLVKWDLKSEPISATRESLRFRLKTSNADGVLLYSRGTQGDFVALQLRQNRLILNIDLGSGLTTSLSVGSLLDDNLWHDVVISRNRRDIVFSVDRVIIHGRVKGEFNRLDLNRQMYIGGVPNIQDGLVVNQNFTGCLENLFFNNTNLISEVKTAYDTRDDWLLMKYKKVNTLYSCPVSISLIFLYYLFWVIGDMYKDHATQINELKEILKKEENLHQLVLLENSTLKDKIEHLDTEILKLKTSEPVACPSCVQLKITLQQLKIDLADNSSKFTSLQLQIENSEATYKQKIHEYRKKISSLKEELGSALNRLEEKKHMKEASCSEASAQTENLPVQISGHSGIVQSVKIKEQEEKIQKMEKENCILKRMCQSRLQTIQQLKAKLETASKPQRNVLEEVQNHQT